MANQMPTLWSRGRGRQNRSWIFMRASPSLECSIIERATTVKTSLAGVSTLLLEQEHERDTQIETETHRNKDRHSESDRES